MKPEAGIPFDRMAPGGLWNREAVPCGGHMRPFRPRQVIGADDSLAEVVRTLTLHEHAFVSLLGEVVGCVDRGAVGKPVARMWLFGFPSKRAAVAAAKHLASRLEEAATAWRLPAGAGGNDA